MQEIVPWYQCANHQLYRSRFGAVSNKLPYVLCRYWKLQYFLHIFVIILIHCSPNCSSELCV